MNDGRYEVWHALHDECPSEGCGNCVGIELEWTDEEFREISTAAYWAGESVGAYLHRVIVMGMKHENSGN